MKTGLYRFYDADDVLLYVGISKNPFNRLGQHITARGGGMEQVSKIAFEYDAGSDLDKGKCKNR